MPTAYPSRHARRREAAVDQPGPLTMVWVALRFVLAFIFLWAFFDKLLGLGFSTPPERAWVNGGSPTAGFLGATEGPTSPFFQALAGNVLVDWLFMLGLLLIGLALLLGVGMRVAGVAGALLMLLMWAALMPGETNPLVDDHIVNALVFLGFAFFPEAGAVWGAGRWWQRQETVRRHAWLA